MSDDKKKTSEEEKAPPGWLDQDPFANGSTKSSGTEKKAASAKPDAPPPQNGNKDDKDDEDDKDKGQERVKKGRKSRSTRKVPAVDQKTRDPKEGKTKTAARAFPLWGWIMIAVVLLGLLGLALDFRNRDRYRLDCSDGVLALQEGRRLPWPLGFESVGDAYEPMKLSDGQSCQSRIFTAREDAEAAFIEQVVYRAKELLKNSPSGALSAIEMQLKQVYRASRFGPHRKRRKQIRRLLADVAYREGRAGLSRAENELRQTLARLKQAEKYGGDHYEDLEDWIEHLESLLKAITPTPAQKKPALPNFGRSDSHTPQNPPPPTRKRVLSPKDGGAPTLDGGARESDGNGILM
jgi:hypothetical protein